MSEAVSTVVVIASRGSGPLAVVAVAQSRQGLDEAFAIGGGSTTLPPLGSTLGLEREGRERTCCTPSANSRTTTGTSHR